MVHALLKEHYGRGNENLSQKMPLVFYRARSGVRGGLVRSDRICEFLSGIAGAIKLPILSLAAWLRGCVAAWLRGCVAAWLRGEVCFIRCLIGQPGMGPILVVPVQVVGPAKFILRAERSRRCGLSARGSSPVGSDRDAESMDAA
jgi:hypothetical protein